jgi:hypothetical protein
MKTLAVDQRRRELSAIFFWKTGGTAAHQVNRGATERQFIIEIQVEKRGRPRGIGRGSG